MARPEAPQAQSPVPQTQPPEPKPEKDPPKPEEKKIAVKKEEKKIAEKVTPPDDIVEPKTSAAETTQPAKGEFTEKLSNAEFTGAFEDASFQYPDWNYQGFNKIARAWRNHVFSAKPLSCVIYFRALKSGRIYGARIKESSGIDRFDRDCLDAVLKADPLPPLPREYRHEEIGVSLVFPYKP